MAPRALHGTRVTVARATATLTGQETTDVLQAFGQSAMPIILKRFPLFAEALPITFLLSGTVT